MPAAPPRPSSDDTPSSAADDPRTCIGGHRLQRRLGRGGMADVWVARRDGNAGTKFVAIKLIASRHAGDERYVRMFHAEAELSALLSHSNIVQVFDAGEHEGRAYLVMEWVDGPSLAKLMPAVWAITDPLLKQRLAAYIVGQLLHALSYAHSITNHAGHDLGIVHRDVSPHNVLLSVSGDVKLADFGIAHRSSDQTSGQYVKGKLRYMPREQLTSDDRTPSLDLYPVGAMLHEMLEGRRFRHAADDEMQLYRCALAAEIPALPLPIAPELERLRVALLQPDPAYRPASAEHALAMLKRWPGYVDMRLELGQLCARIVGVAGPRTGPGLTSPPGRAEVELSRPPPTAAGDRTATLDGPGPEVLGCTTTSCDGPPLTHATTSSVCVAPVPRSDATIGPPGARGRPVPWLEATLALIGAICVGFAGAWVVFGAEREQVAMSVAATAEAAPGFRSEDSTAVEFMPRPPAPPTEAPSRLPSPADPMDLEVEPTTRSEAVHIAAAQREVESDTQKRRRRRRAGVPTPRNGPPVMVHLRLSGIESAQVAIAGHVVDVAPRRAMKIPSGTYRVRWRRDPRHPWRRAKRMVLAADMEWVIRIGAEGPRLLDLRTASR